MTDFHFVTKRLIFFKLNMAALYTLVEFIALFFYYYYYFYSREYHSRYMTGDCEFYGYMCKYLVYTKEKLNTNI